MDTCTTTVFFAAIHAFIFLHYCPTSALAGNFAGDGNTVSDTDLRGIVNALVSGLIVAIVALNIVVFALKQVFGEREKPPSSSSSSYERLCRPFSIAEINSATKNFDTGLVIGRGRFGNVYKGTIAEKAVAIKLWDSASKQAAREFRTEVQMFALHGFRHSHVASLVGYCEHYSNLILVYEFMPLGTLAHNIHKVSDSADCSDISTRLSWVERVKICIGAARGLDYLHTGTSFEHRVMHRHVKSSNILLDMSRTAKVFDFGLSKIGPANQSCALVSTKIKGTFGYLDPEYLVTARLTVKSDVYAFGVVLFEVLTGRPAVDSRLDEEERSLARWAKQCVKRGTIGQIVDPVLREERICLESLEEFVRIADQCLHKHSSKRPTMAEVVVSLESALRLQEGTCSPLVEVITNAGNRGASNNQNILDSSLQEEVVNACNGGHNNEQIDRTSNGGGIYNNQQDGDLRTGHEGANGNVACHEEDTNGAYNNQQSRDFITEQEVIGGNVGHHDKRINGNSDTDHANNIQEHADSSAEQVAANTVNGGHDLQTDGTIRLGDASGKQSRKKPAMKTLTKFFSDRAGMISGAGAKQSRLKRSYSNNGGVGALSGKIVTPNLKLFTFNDLSRATRNFTLRSGGGDFEMVFKGWVDKKTFAPSTVGVGMAVAVKKLNLYGPQGTKEAQLEVKFLGKICHPNLVKLLGYCSEDGEFLLVHEYMEGGSLERHLFIQDAEPLALVTRLKIAIDAARALAFLHAIKKQVIYRGFKASDVLLDGDSNAKLSDFGLAKFRSTNGESHISSLLVGDTSYTNIPKKNIGYIAPEYVTT
ncbi:hypothetical protein RJ640_003066, partial [Escallonia rubra]